MNILTENHAGKPNRATKGLKKTKNSKDRLFIPG